MSTSSIVDTISDNSVQLAMCPKIRAYRQIGRRRSPLSDGRLSTTKGVAIARLRKTGGDCLTQAMGAIRNAVEARLFTAQVDAENLAAAARAEINAAAALDSKLEFNRAAQRGAALALSLAEAAWAGRASRLKGLEEAMRISGQFTTPRMFWVMPRAEAP